MDGIEKSIDYCSPIDDDFQDPNWDSVQQINVKPSFVLIEGNEKICSFNISNLVVTQKLFEKVMGMNPSLNLNDNLPVERVSWYEAITFCNKLSSLKKLSCCYDINGTNIKINVSANGYRLPSKKEWIFAAVGGNQKNDFIYAGSNKISDVAWFNVNSACKVQIPGQKNPNSVGLYDMSGNIWEWTNDSIDSQIIVCGGAVNSSSSDCEILNQGQKTFRPETKNETIGFRLVKKA